MRKLLATCLAIAGLTMLGSASVIPVQSGDVSVTVTYKGKGPVDDKHQILVFLFDHPIPTAESRPLALQTVVKNGGTATFKSVSTSPVYVTLVYDEKSNYDGRSGPPPAGTPVSQYQKAGKPVPVTPGAGTKVTATFDDTRRWK